MSLLLSRLKPVLIEQELALLAISGRLVWNEIEKGETQVFQEDEIENFDFYSSVRNPDDVIDITGTRSLLFEEIDGSGFMYALIRVDHTPLAEPFLRKLGYCPMYFLVSAAASSEGVAINTLGLVIGAKNEANFDPRFSQTKLVSLDGNHVNKHVYEQIVRDPSLLGLWRFQAVETLIQKGLLIEHMCTAVMRHSHCMVGSFTTKSEQVH